MDLKLVTEVEIHTSDGGTVSLDALHTNYMVVYNDKNTGVRCARDTCLSDVYVDLAYGDVFALIISDLECTDEDDEAVGTRDIVVYGTAISSIFAISDTVAV